MKFRKKPVIIEATNVDTIVAVMCRGNTTDLPKWLQRALETGVVTLTNDSLYVRTLEGVMKASPGDWIILGTKGEIYPCKPDIFAQCYEPVTA